MDNHRFSSFPPCAIHSTIQNPFPITILRAEKLKLEDLNDLAQFSHFRNELHHLFMVTWPVSVRYKQNKSQPLFASNL